MSSRGLWARGALRIRPTAWHRVYLPAVHVLAAWTSLAVPLTWPWRWGLTVAVAVSFVLLWRRHVGSRAIGGLEWTSDGQWWLEEVSGKRARARLTGAHAGAVLTVMRFRVEGRWLARSLVLVQGGADFEDWRRLRVWLRHGRQSAFRTPSHQ